MASRSACMAASTACIDAETERGPGAADAAFSWAARFSSDAASRPPLLRRAPAPAPPPCCCCTPSWLRATLLRRGGGACTRCWWWWWYCSCWYCCCCSELLAPCTGYAAPAASWGCHSLLAWLRRPPGAPAPSRRCRWAVAETGVGSGRGSCHRRHCSSQARPPIPPAPAYALLSPLAHPPPWARKTPCPAWFRAPP